MAPAQYKPVHPDAVAPKGFNVVPTNCHLRYRWFDGKWEPCEVVNEPFIKLSINANCFHYGQALFEGLKAFRNREGEIMLFRPEENAKRCRESAERIMIPGFPEDEFVKACHKAVELNNEYCPPHGSGGALYIRPFMIGAGDAIGLYPANEYYMFIMVTPVGDYYATGVKGVDALVFDEYDRAAPLGVGRAKVAGNYAASLLPSYEASQKGFPISLYLDPKTHTTIEEFSTSNFMAVDNEGKKYITPDSDSILESITNKSLCQLAKSEGLVVERRSITYSEIEEGKFSETGAVGTAVVMTPVHSFTFRGKKTTVTEEGRVGFGPVQQKLCDIYRAIQFGDVEDRFGWMQKLQFSHMNGVH
eukprot:Clim_evm18s214 gene=Clim_evmTU18s214